MIPARKICLLGDYGVGKTSLVARYVRQTFSERYLSTVGVKIDTKLVELGDRDKLKLVIWDIAGEVDVGQAHIAYLRGVSGALVVADGTRAPTAKSAQSLLELLHRHCGSVPVLALANKADLSAEWELPSDAQLSADNPWRNVSAMEDHGVEEAFVELARRISKRESGDGH